MRGHDEWDDEDYAEAVQLVEDALEWLLLERMAVVVGP
jgi:hypothetical protein